MIVAQSPGLGGTGYQPVAAGNLPAASACPAKVRRSGASVAVLLCGSVSPNALSGICVYPRESVVKKIKVTLSKLSHSSTPRALPPHNASGQQPIASFPFISNRFARLPAAQNYRNSYQKTRELSALFILDSGRRALDFGHYDPLNSMPRRGVASLTANAGGLHGKNGNPNQGNSRVFRHPPRAKPKILRPCESHFITNRCK
jgi:hypothetical protein